MRSSEASAPFSACVHGINVCREKCVRNKRKFPAETRPSLRVTNKTSSNKPGKETESTRVPMNNLNCVSVDSHNIRFSHHQGQSSDSEANLQRPEQLFCNYLQYMSDRDTKVGISLGHEQRCRQSEGQAGNWDIDTESQLEELLIKYLESICNGAVKKVVSYGYSMEEAKKAVLRIGLGYRVGDALSSLGEKALLYLASANLESDKTELPDFNELHTFLLAEMIRVLREIQPSLKTGDALWCLIACDMNMAQASLMQGASSSSLNALTMPRSIGAFLPDHPAPSLCRNEAECTNMADIASNPPFECQVSSLCGAVAQTMFISENGAPQDSSESPVPPVDGCSQSDLVTSTERVGKEHQPVPVVSKPTSASSITLRSAASLSSTCSKCCGEETTLSIGPPVCLPAQPYSPLKAATDYLNSPASRERGKGFEEWTSPSTSSELVKPAIPMMSQNSSSYSGELSLQDSISNTDLASGSPSGTHYNRNMHFSPGSTQGFYSNVAGERYQPGLGTSSTSNVSSPWTSSKSSHSSGVANASAYNLSTAGKELSLAIASVMDCPKMDVSLGNAFESMFHSAQYARELDNKGLVLEDLLHRVKDLEATLQERSKWAREKVTHAAKRLITDFSELKALRLEREEAARLRKEKQALEENSKKKISDMEVALRKTIGQVECANTAVRRLEIENAELRAEMEAAKLSAAESAANDKAVAKREKKALKKEQTWERQRAKLQGEIALEKQKITQLQLELSQVKEECQVAELRWRQEVKAKEAAMNLAESERRAKEQVEIAAKKREESFKRKVEADDRRHQDDIARLEDEIAHLSLTKDASKQTLLHLEPSSGVTSISKSTQPVQELRNINIRLLQEVADVHSPLSRDLPRDRECVMCMSEERSVVFLPCAHQVICVECNSLHEAQGMKDCPSCRTFIAQRIRVYGANA